MATKILFKGLDKGFGNAICCRRTKKTKCTTIQQYVNLYAGPQHVMHFKYATIASTVLTTFLYGMALPILFPIAMLTFINIYVVEKILLAYWYQAPPSYGPELNALALKVL